MEGTNAKNHSNFTIKETVKNVMLQEKKRALASLWTWDMVVKTWHWPNSWSDWWSCHASHSSHLLMKRGAGAGEKCLLPQPNAQDVSAHIIWSTCAHNAGNASSCWCPRLLTLILCCPVSSINGLLHALLPEAKSYTQSKNRFSEPPDINNLWFLINNYIFLLSYNHFSFSKMCYSPIWGKICKIGSWKLIKYPNPWPAESPSLVVEPVLTVHHSWWACSIGHNEQPEIGVYSNCCFSFVSLSLSITQWHQQLSCACSTIFSLTVQ